MRINMRFLSRLPKCVLFRYNGTVALVHYPIYNGVTEAKSTQTDLCLSGGRSLRSSQTLELSLGDPWWRHSGPSGASAGTEMRSKASRQNKVSALRNSRLFLCGIGLFLMSCKGDHADCAFRPFAVVEAPAPIICVDPGHSRETRGARGRHSSEYQITWQVALKLKAALESRGIRVAMTKDSVNQNMTNEERAAIANRVRAHLFVRLHCDAGSGAGAATFYPARQGETGGVRGPGPSVITASRQCARLFHPAMMRSLSGLLRDRGIRTEAQTQIGARQGALTGSIFSRVPVVLIEMCVLSNPHDEAFITSGYGQQSMAFSLADGVEATFSPARVHRGTSTSSRCPVSKARIAAVARTSAR